MISIERICVVIYRCDPSLIITHSYTKGIIGIPIKILLLPVFVDNVDKRLGYVYL